MKIFLILLISALATINAFSQVYYYYKGNRIDLQVRQDRIAIILKSGNYTENYVRSNIRINAGMKNDLKKVSSSVYTISYETPRSESEMESDFRYLTSNNDFIKFIAKTYYGTSKKVTQIAGDRFILKLKRIQDKEKLDAMNVIYNCTLTGSDRTGTEFIVVTNSNENRNSLELSEIYNSTGLFEYAEPDFLYPEGCLMLSVPNDLNYPKQWSLNNSGQLVKSGSPFLLYGDAANVNGIPGSDMNVESAWDITTGSGNIKIGVIDSGIDSLHPDFQQAGHLIPGYDAFNDINSSAVDVGNHGTSVAGLIGAVMNNSIGIAGVAPTCKLMSICIFDINGNTSNSIIARAFDTAVARGIDVLSNSWGGGTPSSVITNAIDNAAINGRNNLGCVILFASGNDGHNPPVYPSLLPNVLSIGASTPHDQAKSPGTGNQFYWGSNYGENEMGDLDMVAPTNCYTLLSGGGYEENFWGTSASCPNAAGVAALVLSVNGSQTRTQVYYNLLRGCDKIDNVNYDFEKSFGKWNAYYGYGRVNALNSVRLAAGVDVTPPVIGHQNVASTSSTYPVIINAIITDQDGSPVPQNGANQPKLFYKVKKGTASWTNFDSLTAYSVSGNNFSFKIPSAGWETEYKYYLRARDVIGNETTFPKHAPNPFWLCYFAVGNITSDTKKIPAFSGADYGATLSSSVTFGTIRVLNTKVIIHMRHTYLDDEVIQLFSPLSDANNNRKCLFASNGNDGDNIYGATVSDSSSQHWSESTPPFLNGKFKPEYNMQGLNGNTFTGNWKIIHFDRGVTDYAFFDSVKIILCKTTGAYSSSVRLNNANDSIINFDSSFYSENAERIFYLKNSGTSNLNISGYYFTGSNASMFSVINTPPTVIAPNDSGLFKIKLTTLTSAATGMQGDSYENAVFNIQTNDPSKPVFKVSVQTDQQPGLKQLNLTALIEGLYNAQSGTAVSDSLKVYLANSNPPYNKIDSSKGILNNSGYGSFLFPNVQNNVNYFIVVNYRNGINTWSKTGQKFTNSILNYNFTDSLSKAYGNNLVLMGSKYCIYSGDVNKDGAVDSQDISRVENNSFLSLTGYLSEDLNNDGIVDASDIGIVENNSSISVQAITP